MKVKATKKAVLMGVAGSNNAFSLSLYNLKAYSYNDPLIRKNWNISVIQHPIIGHPDQFEKKHSNTLKCLWKKSLMWWVSVVICGM